MMLSPQAHEFPGQDPFRGIADGEECGRRRISHHQRVRGILIGPRNHIRAAENRRAEELTYR